MFADPKSTAAKDVLKSKIHGVSADDVTNILCQLLKLQAAPDVEIDAFDGNPLNYLCFMALFKKAKERKIDEPKGQLTTLINAEVKLRNLSNAVSNCQI